MVAISAGPRPVTASPSGSSFWRTSGWRTASIAALARATEERIQPAASEGDEGPPEKKKPPQKKKSPAKKKKN